MLIGAWRWYETSWFRRIYSGRHCWDPVIWKASSCRYREGEKRIKPRTCRKGRICLVQSKLQIRRIIFSLQPGLVSKCPQSITTTPPPQNPFNPDNIKGLWSFQLTIYMLSLEHMTVLTVFTVKSQASTRGVVQ